MSQESFWIDFKELRASLKFDEVLKHYKVKLKDKGEQFTGLCPLPSHKRKGTLSSFSVNLKRGIFQCFGCHAKGNVLDFCCRMEGFNPNLPNELRKAALKVRDIFIGRNAPAKKERPKKENPRIIINAALDFDLRTLDPNHPYLKERGFTDETIRHFGLGFCNRGMLKGRIAIPLHDPKGKLVGYAGRLTKDENVNERTPKYLFPGERERDGVKFAFRKSLLLYNAHRINAPVDHLFIVQGFPATWWLWQAEYRNTVALMGASCSEEQAKHVVDLVKPDGKVWVMPDGDEAAIRCAKSVLGHVALSRLIRWIPLANGMQPTDYPMDELAALFGV